MRACPACRTGNDRGRTACAACGAPLALAPSELELELARLDALLRSVGQGIYTIDLDGRLTSLNRPGEELLGWTEEELRGRNIHETIHF